MLRYLWRNKVISIRRPHLRAAMNSMDDDSPWDADPNPSYAHQSEWSKITSDFTNVRQPTRPKARNLTFDSQGRLS